MKKILGVVLLCTLYSLADSQTIIAGKVLGCDGRPMPMSHVHIDGAMGHFQALPQLNDVNYSRAEANADGSFIISTNEVGSLNLVFTGVGHKLMQIPLILEYPVNIEVKVQLQQVTYSDNFVNIEVGYDYEDYSKGKTVRMKKQPDGTYLAEIQTEKSKITYRLLHIGGAKTGTGTNGTMSDAYEYLGEGSYASIIHSKNGIAKIVFDPSKIIRTTTPESITFSDTNSFQAKFVTLYQSSKRNKETFETVRKKHILAGKKPSTFLYDWHPAIKLIIEKLNSERHQLLRHELILQYLELLNFAPTSMDTVHIRKLLKEIPPTSPVWAYHENLAFYTQKYHPQGNNFFNKILAQHPSRSFRASLLYWACVYAQAEKDIKAYSNFFYQLVNEFGDTPAGKAGKVILHPKDKIRVGASLPSFSFVSFDNPEEKFTNQSFAGKYLLIDFWGTWCQGCISEMGNLHTVYEKFKEKNFEILSIAGYDSPDRVKRFRATKWKMPWSNVLIEPGKEPDIVMTFEVGAFPHPILISPTGKILALEEYLRGDNLEKTLEKYLNGNN